jgi:hypothetical protein
VTTPLLHALAIHWLSDGEIMHHVGVTDSDEHSVYVSWLDGDGYHKTHRIWVDADGRISSERVDGTTCPSGGHRIGELAHYDAPYRSVGYSGGWDGCPACVEWRAVRWERGDDYDGPSGDEEERFYGRAG